MRNKTYNVVLEKQKIKRPILKNVLRAFYVGGLIGLIGQFLLWFYNKKLGIEMKNAQTLMAMTLVAVASLLTGFGIFDIIGEYAGAGTYIPITGFANSVSSTALESKSEGLILGVLMNMFKLAGAVIATGIISSFVVGLIAFLVRGVL